MWIRIHCMRIRIHKILWMRIRIRIQVNKITRFISTHLLQVEKKCMFKSVPKPSRLANFFKFRLEKYNFLRKNPPNNLLAKLFPFILYLWIRIHGPKECSSDRIRNHITVYKETLWNSKQFHVSTSFFLLNLLTHAL